MIKTSIFRQFESWNGCYDLVLLVFTSFPDDMLKVFTCAIRAYFKRNTSTRIYLEVKILQIRLFYELQTFAKELYKMQCFCLWS